MSKSPAYPTKLPEYYVYWLRCVSQWSKCHVEHSLFMMTLNWKLFSIIWILTFTSGCKLAGWNLKNPLQQTYYASARGGGSIARYFVSMNMSNESAIYKQDENSKYIKDVPYNTYGMRLNVDFNLIKTNPNFISVRISTYPHKWLPGQGASTDQLWDAQAKLTPLTIPVRYSTGELPTYKSGAKKDVYHPMPCWIIQVWKTSILTLAPIQYAYSKISVFYWEIRFLTFRWSTATALILKRHVLSSPTCIGRNAGMRTELGTLYTL